MNQVCILIFLKMLYSSLKLLEKVKKWDKKQIDGANGCNYELKITNYE